MSEQLLLKWNAAKDRLDAAKAAERVKNEEEERQLHREEAESSAPPEPRHVRPCFSAMLGRPTLPHKMRVAAVSEYHHRAGLGEDELVALFRGQEDFDEDRTRYQVQHILKRGYKPWRCSTIREAGLCLDEGCPLRKGRRLRP